jgi:hypothetical protein
MRKVLVAAMFLGLVGSVLPTRANSDAVPTSMPVDSINAEPVAPDSVAIPDSSLVFRIANFLTFDFYASHRVHHFLPRRTTWALAEPVATVAHYP